MNQISALIQQLKHVLKASGITYKDIAQRLALSESTVKRTFTKGAMSLERLEIMCEMANLELAELMDMVTDKTLCTNSLTFEQEQELVADSKLLLTAHLLINKWTVPQILANYQIERLEMTRLLARLDKMQLLEYLPNEKVRMKVSRQFHWLEQGPIQQFFNQHIQAEFFDCDFSSPGEIKLFVSGMLSRNSNEAMQQKIHKLAEYFDELHKQDEKTALGEKFGTSLSVAMRPWDLKLFTDLRREHTFKQF